MSPPRYKKVNKLSSTQAAYIAGIVDEEVKQKIYEILYNEFNGENPNI